MVVVSDHVGFGLRMKLTHTNLFYSVAYACGYASCAYEVRSYRQTSAAYLQDMYRAATKTLCSWVDA